MARRTGNAAVGARQFVCMMALAVDTGDADGDVTIGVCPGDESVLIGATATMATAGTGTQNHGLVIEHGAGAAGVPMAASVNVLADAAAGTIVSFDSAILAPDGQPATVYGTTIQVENTEGGAIADGAILDWNLIWQL